MIRFFNPRLPVTFLTEKWSEIQKKYTLLFLWPMLNLIQELNCLHLASSFSYSRCLYDGQTRHYWYQPAMLTTADSTTEIRVYIDTLFQHVLGTSAIESMDKNGNGPVICWDKLNTQLVTSAYVFDISGWGTVQYIDWKNPSKLSICHHYTSPLCPHMWQYLGYIEILLWPLTFEYEFWKSGGVGRRF